VNVALPPQFPHAAPVVRARHALFHPNVADDYVHITPAWNPATSSLAELVSRCGELLAFQVYDPAAVYNAAAMQWITQYPHLVPTERNAVFTPDADGDGLARIVRSGPQTLEQLRTRLAEVSQAILQDAPGTAPADVRAFAARACATLDVFSEADVPEKLRAEAAELDAWARSLATPGRTGRTVWDELRALYANTRSATRALGRVGQTRDELDEAVRAVEPIVNAEPDDDPRETLAMLPAAAALDPIVIRLRGAIRAADEQASALRAALDGLSAPPPAPVGPPGGMLHERTQADVTRGALAASAARERGQALLQQIEPTLARGRAELAAVEHLDAWAGFTELVRRGNELVQRLNDRGAASIQAYHVATPDGTFGPYEFEERVELGSVMLVARRIGAGAVEAFDARSMAVLGKGSPTARVRFSDSTETVSEAEIRATDHTDELRIQFEYVTKTCREQLALLGRLGGPTAAAATSWAGRFSAVLSKDAATHEAAEVYRRASHRWTTVLADLDELAQFKERVATYHLLQRHAEFVPAVLTIRSKAQVALKEANERLAFIASRSTRDMDTEQILIPAQFAAENIQRLKQRERAEKDLAKVRKLLGLVVGELQLRMSEPRLVGKAGPPRLHLLALPPHTYGGAEQWSSDARIRTLVAELEELLGTELSRA
jgi:hypothetical protein